VSTAATPACPDWRALVARPDAGRPTGRDDTAWESAMAHLDGCGACRESALAADPTLVFRRLRGAGASAAAAADAESMRQAVASLRRASRVTAVESGAGDALEAPAGGRLRRVAGPRLRRAAAALLLAAAGVGVWFAGQDEPVQPAASARHAAAPAASFAEPWAALTAPSATSAPRSAEELASQPVFEGLSKPRAADVYQLGEEDLLVVMVVDETLDI